MYQKAVIYKICCKDINIKEIYVGSTCNFNRRRNGHKSMCKSEKGRYYNLSVYQYIRNNGGWDNWDMIMIEQFSCEDKRQLEKRERFWLETLGATLNKQMPTRTKREYEKQYREKNKEKISEKSIEYREKNKEKISEKNKEYFQKNKEKISEKNKEYREKNKETISEKSKEYYEKNKEKIIDKSKEYYEKNKEKRIDKSKEYFQKNKEKISEKNKEKYTCVCGSTLTKCNKPRHEKSKKHQNFIESQNE